MKESFGEKVLSFNNSLYLDIQLPENVAVMNPFRGEETLKVTGSFYQKFYNDEKERIFLFGINPGRFGAGVTGVCFTDPIRLEKELGIENSFEKKPELSSVFVYDVIKSYGGPEAFYGDCYITAISPLGFTRKGLNLNYYDDKNLQQSLKPFIIESIKKQLDFGAKREICICIGEGKNYDFFRKLNAEQGFFQEVLPLAHPRFVMQYRLRHREQYIRQYVEAIRQAVKF